MFPHRPLGNEARDAKPARLTIITRTRRRRDGIPDEFISRRRCLQFGLGAQTARDDDTRAGARGRGAEKGVASGGER